MLTQRNLAGFFNWNAYELNDLFDGIAVEGGMVVPYGLVMPLMLADDCVDATDGQTCLGFPRYRIDGGPVVTAHRAPEASATPSSHIQQWLARCSSKDAHSS